LDPRAEEAEEERSEAVGFFSRVKHLTLSLAYEGLKAGSEPSSGVCRIQFTVDPPPPSSNSFFTLRSRNHYLLFFSFSPSDGYYIYHHHAGTKWHKLPDETLRRPKNFQVEETTDARKRKSLSKALITTASNPAQATRYHNIMVVVLNYS